MASELLTANIKHNEKWMSTEATPAQLTSVKQGRLQSTDLYIFSILQLSQPTIKLCCYSVIASIKTAQLDILACIMISSKVNVQQWM
jgi:hypothetical protein